MFFFVRRRITTKHFGSNKQISYLLSFQNHALLSCLFDLAALKDSKAHQVAIEISNFDQMWFKRGFLPNPVVLYQTKLKNQLALVVHYVQNSPQLPPREP